MNKVFDVFVGILSKTWSQRLTINGRPVNIGLAQGKGNLLLGKPGFIHGKILLLVV